MHSIDGLAHLLPLGIISEVSKWSHVWGMQVLGSCTLNLEPSQLSDGLGFHIPCHLTSDRHQQL